MPGWNKDLIAASLAPMVMMILNDNENYGYEIIQQLKIKSKGKLDVAEGTLYPVLKKLEQKKWIAAEWKTADNGRERRYYKITKSGKAQLTEHMSQWKLLDNLIQQLWKPQTSTFSKLLLTI